MTTLTEQREELVMDLKYGTNPNAFPGSAEWRKAQDAKQALSDFDVAHPEIKAEAQARAEKKAAYRSDTNSHYNRALRMED